MYKTDRVTRNRVTINEGVVMKLSKTQSWKEFEFLWGTCTSEEGATGLLYAAAKLRKSGLRTENEWSDQDQVRCFNHKVDFFLELTTQEENPAIATIARKLIINELLSEGLSLSWTGLVGPAHAKLVDFLGKVHDDLRKQPFPRKVNEFLFQAFHRWKAAEREMEAPIHRRREMSLDRVLRLTSEYDQTVPLISACVAWGSLSEILRTQWFTPDMLVEIRAWAVPRLMDSLGEDEKLQEDRLAGSLTWAMDEHPVDLYSENGRNLHWRLNGIAIHYLKSKR
jgi:hypothetical protein